MNTGTASVLGARLDWLRAGDELFLGLLDALPDDGFAAPSTLPGWTRGHLLAHVADNARALCRLLHWARTGEPTPMYVSAEARAAAIVHGAGLPPRLLRAFLRSTRDELGDALARLPEPAWSAEVVTAQGRTVDAAEIPWLRVRELWVHAVDLDRGTSFADFPPSLLDALLDDVAALRRRRAQPPALTLVPDDRDRVWRVEVEGAPEVELTGSTAALAAALTGRGTEGVSTRDGPLPPLGDWL